MQEEVLYPIHFSLNFNDWERAFIDSNAIPYEMKGLHLFLLMYAGDIVIFSKYFTGLQNMLDSLYEYIPLYRKLMYY